MAAKKAALMIDEMYQVFEIWFPLLSPQGSGIKS